MTKPRSSIRDPDAGANFLGTPVTEGLNPAIELALPGETIFQTACLIVATGASSNSKRSARPQ